MLLTSELVTNAVVHAGTEAEVVCSLLLDAIQIDVVDRYPSRPLPVAPVPAPLDSEGGRGLQLTAEIAQEWGVDYSTTTKRVWVRLPLGEQTGRAPVDTHPEQQPLEPAEDDALGVAVVRVDDTGRIRGWPAAAAALFGWDAEEVLGTRLASLLDPEAGAEQLPAESFAGRWQGSYAVRHRDGRDVPVTARHVRLGDGHGDGSVLCLLVDQRLRALLAEPTRPEAEASAVESDSVLALSSSALVRLELEDLLQRTVDWVKNVLAGEGAYALLATEAGHELELRASTGLGSDLPRFARLNVDEGIAGRLSTSLMPIVHDDLPAGAGELAWLREAGVRSVVAAPLLAEGRLVGVLGVTSGRSGRFTNDDGARLQKAADQVALSVQTARLSELERDRRGWLGYLAEASDLLAGTLELEMTLALVAQVVVPRLAPWCAIYLLDESGVGHPAYVWHADEEHLENLQSLLEKAPPPEIPPANGIEHWQPAEGLSMPWQESGVDVVAAGASVVPLAARGRPIGSLALGRPRQGPERRGSLELASDLARRAALALDNARLYADRSATSRALQHSLLPPELPALPGVEVGAGYQAAGAGNEVGGDFYDLFTLEGGRFAFAVGDVCGKGPEAAAVTGLARHAMRLLSRRGDGLREVLQQLNAAILDGGTVTRFVTVMYGEGERTAAGGLRLHLVCAGHPLPFLVRPDGAVDRVGETGDLLGVFETPRTPVCEVEVAPGESLVCFTDGVTERRDGSRMLGEHGVGAILSAAAGLPAPGLVRRLETAVLEFAAEPPRDDLAILVLRAT